MQWGKLFAAGGKLLGRSFSTARRHSVVVTHHGSACIEALAEATWLGAPIRLAEESVPVLDAACEEAVVDEVYRVLVESPGLRAVLNLAMSLCQRQAG